MEVVVGDSLEEGVGGIAGDGIRMDWNEVE